MSTLKLWLLGPPRIERDGASVILPRRKPLALLAYLALTAEPQPRDTLAALLWPDGSQSSAYAGLRRDLSLLNKALGGDWLDIDRQTIGLRFSPGLWLDLAQFQQRLADCQTHGHPADETCPACLAPLTEAVSLYRADFLAGFSLPACPGFDEWQFFQSESLRQALASVLERLGRFHSDQKDYEPAIIYARRRLNLDPLHEPVHRLLMQLYAWSGQQSAALRQYSECVRLLAEEFGLPPEAETTELYEAIKARRILEPPIQAEEQRSRGAGEIEDREWRIEDREWRMEDRKEAASASILYPLSSSSPLPPISSAPLHNLPSQPTPFIGRAEELVRIAGRLADPACRLLTLTGPGGVGKTRLALQAAQNLVESSPGPIEFGDGVYFVPLAGVTSADFLVSTIAGALHFSFYSDVDPKVQLLNYLREKAMLLVLDNFEQLLPPPLSPPSGGTQGGSDLSGEMEGGADLLTEILAAAPAVKILVTSREALNLQEEWFQPVGGLPFPKAEGEAVAVETYNAIQLFVQCARRARPGFSLAAEVEAVVRICRVVEGIPLAIELAAAWLKMLSCSKIVQEIERGLDFLATSLRNVPARHRSMRAVFEQSWRLLTETEQGVLGRLSVFQGGFRLEAAEQVAGVSLLVLTALVDKSLVQATSSGRYQMHELLRQFAEEKLYTISAVQNQTRNWHSAYYAAFLQKHEAALMGVQQETLAEIGEEIGNIRAGWSWAVEQGHIDEINQALGGLFHFYEIRNWFQEGEEAFSRAIVRCLHPQSSIEAEGPLCVNPKSEILLGKLLARQGAFCFELGLYERARELLHQGLAMIRPLELREEIAFVLNILGDVASEQGEYIEAKQLYQESLAISRKSSDAVGVIEALHRLGEITEQIGEYIEAKQLYQESLTLSREIGNRGLIAYTLDGLGTVAFYLGEYMEGRQYYRESLAIFKEIGDRYGLAMALGGLGAVAWGLGSDKLTEAKSLFEESLAICREIGHRRHMVGRLYGLGSIANDLKEYEAAQGYGREALTISKEIGAIFGIIASLDTLGMAAIGLGHFQTARSYLYEALKIGMKSRMLLPVFGALLSWATLLAKEAIFLAEDSLGRTTKQEWAIELLALLRHHPASIQVDKDQATRLLAELEAELPPEVVAAAQERGRTRKLEDVVAEILAETTTD